MSSSTTTTPPFAIPTHLRDQLAFRSNPDQRTDNEVLATLTSHVPVTSEKNIWAYWHSGLTSMPAWCRRNVASWARMSGSTWTVRVIDSVPDSPNHALRYLDAALLPRAFVQGSMEGPYAGPHGADLLRGACLFQHGGLFMDVGNVLFRSPERICWAQLEDPASPFRVAVPWMYGCITANHFVASRRGDPFIERWHKLFVHLWQDRSNHSGLRDHPLMSVAKEVSFDDSRASNFNWDFAVDAATVMEYITQVMCWKRLCMLEDCGDGFNGTQYWDQHVLVWDVLQENWGGETVLGFAGFGQKMFDAMGLPLDADPESAAYKEASEVVWRLLTKSTMQKVTHGKGLVSSTTLGSLLDENPDHGSQPGTFGALLRYGAEHFEQVRDGIEYVKTPKPARTLKEGLLEAGEEQ